MPPKKRLAPRSPPKSPTPGPSTRPNGSPPKKRGRIAGTPVKTNKERELESKQEQHPSTNTQRTLSYIGCDSAQGMLKGAIDLDDYKSRLPYFFGRIFLAVRDLRQKEREAICNQTLPSFAKSVDSATVKCEEAFEEAYRLTQFHFISRTIKYGRQWMKSKAGIEFNSKTRLAKKRKKPTLCPQPDLPSRPEHMKDFGGHTGITWEKTQAIDFWAVCLCAFEVEESDTFANSTLSELHWFRERRDKQGVLQKELDGVALELIRRYAVFEVLHPGGYSSTEMVKSLREVMPAVSFLNTSDLRKLFTDLGVTIKDCGERPAAPNVTTNITSHPKAIDDDKQRNGEREDAGPTALQKADLQQVDFSNSRVGSGLPALDDDEPSGYTVYETEATKAQALVDDTFVNEYTQRIASDPELSPVDSPVDIATDNMLLSLHPPKILTGDVSRRAEAYAKGNIWVRSLMGAADRMLEDHRLNALMMAAQQQREMIQHESQQAKKEIENLKKKHMLLKSAWAAVDQAANERDALHAEQSRLESALHGGGTIAGALSDRFKAISANPKHSKRDQKDMGFGLFKQQDTISPPRYTKGTGNHGFGSGASFSVAHTSPSGSQMRQGVNQSRGVMSYDKRSDVKLGGRKDSSSSSASKIALSQPQSQSVSQPRPQTPQVLGGASSSGATTSTEMKAIRDQITEEIEKGKFVDECASNSDALEDNRCDGEDVYGDEGDDADEDDKPESDEKEQENADQEDNANTGEDIESISPTDMRAEGDHVQPHLLDG